MHCVLLRSFALSVALGHHLANAVTLYNSAAQARLQGGSSTSTSSASTYTGAAAFDPLVLTPPTPPGINTTFTIDLAATAPAGVSIAQSGDFLGFSIEFSVADQVIGRNSTLLQVPFLNLMANLVQRGGHVRIRVGGNTQDYASLVPEGSLPNHEIIEKVGDDTNNPTQTPTTLFTPDMIYMLGNVSALLNIGWWLGIPLNETTDIRLGIAEVGEAVLGSRLLGFQVGNEPDLYAAHGHRPANYSPAGYVEDFGKVVEAMAEDDETPERDNLIGPNVSGTWTPEMVFDAGLVEQYGTNLNALAVEHYPENNCAAEYPDDGFGPPIVPQTIFASYLNHTAPQVLVQPYLNSSNYAQEQGKPFLMFETNTASCGGFPGVSDSFGAALWALDYGLTMAYSNFSGANLHVSGQDVYYNPFTPPPTNMSNIEQWTVAPLYYTTLAMAETLGSSNVSRVLDLQANEDSIYTPAYAIYENGAPTRVALFNYVTDPSGASDYKATIQVPGNPSQVQVKYLLSSSVSNKFNITWANQTLGTDFFTSDGRLSGTEDIQTITCNAGSCTIPVPAPSFALVFLTASALASSNASPSSEVTFSTSIATATINTVSVASSVLETSNGHSGNTWHLSSTSQDSAEESAAVGRDVLRSAVASALVAGAMGVFLVGRMLLR